ncbi:murein biosynthesis integral membrane protein MurJ [Patescibacteria group bacterium]|nr:murein biosynthesis integral membrane protein MurJ [Patescibacteria group bacterium]
MINNILNTQTKNITVAALILGAASLGSALLGLFRDRLLAGTFGAGDELDIYYAAFRIPDFVAMILILGAISAAIIPVFSEHLVRSKEEAWEFTCALLNLLLISLIFVCLVLVVFTPFLISLVAPGFEGEKKELTILLTRIMFLSPILLGISSLMSGILQVFHRFLATSLAPIMYNLGIIFGILFFVPQIGISGLAWGVALGGILHFLIQLPAFFLSGFRYKIILDFSHKGIRKVIGLMLPRSLGLAASQINLIVITAIASTLISGSIAIFNLANNLIYILIGLIAVPFSTAVFPALSLDFSKKEMVKFTHKFSSVFRKILFLIIPLSFLFFLLRAQIVRIILGTGQFGWNETRLTAACLGIFSFGIFAQGLVILLSKTFYAVHNTKIPALISVVSVALNIVLCFLFVWLLGFPNIFQRSLIELLKLGGIGSVVIIGLPLALSISGVFQLSLLLIFLQKKLNDLKLKEIWYSFGKILTASLVMVFFTYFSLQIIANFVNMQTFLGVFLQTGIAGLLGIFIYILIAFFLKSPELQAVKSSILKQFSKF